MKKVHPTAFRYEINLVENFLLFLNSTKEQRFFIHSEFEGGFGRPDILLYSTPNVDASLDIQALRTINPRLAPLLSEDIAKKIGSYETLAIACGCTLQQAKIIASELHKINRLFFTDKKQGLFKLDLINKPPFSNIVSIEAKLRDWNRALVQAYRYKTFSNESWVLLDEAHIAPASRAKCLFINSGIGLASFSTKNELRIYVKAKKKPPIENNSIAWRTQAMLSRSVNVQNWSTAVSQGDK